MVAPPGRTACTASPEGSCPRRYSVSPAAGIAGAALSAHAHGISSDSASATAGAAPRGSLGIGCRPWRGILGGSKQVAVIVHQLIRRDKSFDPQPGFPRGGTHQSHRRMAHLLAPIYVEGALCRDAGGERASVILPLGTGVELAGVLAEARGSVLLGVDRNRHQVNPGRLGAELMLELLQRAARERADGRTGGEDEVEKHRPSVIELARQRYGPAVLPYETDLRSLVADCRARACGCRSGSQYDRAGQ